MRPGPVLAVAAALLSLAAGGCGEERGHATRTVPVPLPPATTADARADAVAEVSLVDYALDVEMARVRRAGLIAFVATNDGLVRHALAVDAPAGTVRTPVLRLGERATFSVRLPAGTYKWYCPVADHEQRGMVGRIRIAE
ncbi:MAG TPA: hypothetical protein VGV67_07455 [Solirubrobacteraceae bacterium]|nr:hypothetical protein [Solirubrobacteraceae bacterium]